MTKYTIEYGDPRVNMKVIKIEGMEDADKMFKKLKAYAEKHNLTWVISMWEPDHWLMESITVNPTKIHRVNF